MRLIVAIVLLAISTMSLAWGIAQRTLLEDPETIDVVIEVPSGAPAVVINGGDLRAYPGRQTITIEGGVAGRVPAESGDGLVVRSTNQIIAVYGRTVDVMAWLSPARHTQIRYDGASNAFYALPRAGSDLWLPDPTGSDLWIQEYVGAGSLSFAASIPEDVSIVIVSDGQLPAPQTITLSWPLVVSSPWTTVVIVVGIAALVVGLALIVLHWVFWRQRRGPRRKMTKRPRQRAYRQPRKRRAAETSRGRRRATMAAIPLVGAVVLGATGCQANLDESAPTLVADVPTNAEVQVPYPAVTEVQFSRIMAKVAAQIQAADEALSVNVLGERVVGPTLTARRAAYIIKRADSASAALIPIPSSPIRLVLPQQSQGWPRSVFAIIQDEQDTESPSFGVVLTQQNPRSSYLLSYAIVLAPQVQLPPLPTARTGSAKLSPESKLTMVSPADVLTYYADVINRGSESEHVEKFSVATDALFAAIGPQAESLRQESFGEAVTVDWVTSPTDDDVIAFATADGGALVMGTLVEVETVRPIQTSSVVNAGIGVRALTSLSSSVRGFEVESAIQILWYVPPVGSEDTIRVLGYTYNLVAAREVPSD